MIDKNKGIVYIVHHVDTEGPLYEPIEEIFKRIEVIFKIKLDIEYSLENLYKLQNNGFKQIDKKICNEIKKIIDPHLINYKSDWTKIDDMLELILSKDYRNKYRDSFNNGWIYNWHIMDHVGYITNERRRDIGYLNIFNHYIAKLNYEKSYQDEIHWHFHPISFFREGHICATSYENSYYELHQIICRRLIEKKWFPRVNRAGFHTIRPDSNWFLEQWIPFDASNQSCKEKKTLQNDANFGRFGDWKNALDNWDIYHPDLYDWRKEGTLNRVISRVLNLKTRFRNINVKEIEKAFYRAKNENKNIYLGITNHDFRDISIEIDEFINMLDKVVHKYPDVSFKFSKAINAFQECLYYPNDEIKNNKINFNVIMKDNLLKVVIKNGEIFGSQPYLAIKTITGMYFHDNFDFGDFKKEYFYTFDRHTIPIDMIKKIGIASNDKFGNSCILIIDIENGNIKNIEKQFQ